MHFRDDARIQCDRCDSVLFVARTDLEVRKVGVARRNRGQEEFFRGSTDTVCPSCENYLEIHFEGHEYPAGVFSYGDLEVVGGHRLSGFTEMEVAYDQEVYSFNDERQLLLPKQAQIITSLSSSVASLIIKIAKKPELIRAIGSRKFEELICYIFERNGFSVELTKKTRDGGRDIIALRSDLDIKSRYIIECKRYAANNPVRVDLVRNLYGVQMQEGANKSVLATTSHFTDDAKKFAEAANTTSWAMDLKDYNDVIKWVRDAGRS